MIRGGGSRCCLRGPVVVRRVRDLGGVPGDTTPTALPVAVLLAGACLAASSRTPGARWFGPQPSWWPSWLLFSPALLILWAPGGFRFTCYYYRGAYYKAFWADPPACAVGEPRKSYWGEQPLAADPAERPPLLPVPRAALPRLPRLRRLSRRSGSRTRRRRAVASASASAPSCWPLNVILLGGYTFGCHSLRHLVGGRLDQLSRVAGAAHAPTTA